MLPTISPASTTLIGTLCLHSTPRPISWTILDIQPSPFLSLYVVELIRHVEGLGGESGVGKREAVPSRVLNGEFS
jgi:hypothetical protein